MGAISRQGPLSRIRYASGMSGAQLTRELRFLSRMSQAELARVSGVPRTVINQYERGAREPSAAALQRLAAAAGCALAIIPMPDPALAAETLEQVLDLAESLPHDRVQPLLPSPFPKDLAGNPSTSTVRDLATRDPADESIVQACHAWMPRARARCGRPRGHHGPHRQ